MDDAAALIEAMVPGRHYAVRIPALDGPGDILLDPEGTVIVLSPPRVERASFTITPAGHPVVDRSPRIGREAPEPSPELVALRALLASAPVHPMAGRRCEPCDTGPFELHRDDCPVLLA